MSDTILEVNNLTKHFLINKRQGTLVHAVDNVSFSIKKGKLWALSENPAVVNLLAPEP